MVRLLLELYEWRSGNVPTRLRRAGQPSGEECASPEVPGRLLPVGFFHPFTRFLGFGVAGIDGHYGLVFLDREIAILELIVHFSGSEIGLLE
jgi:hypothetical protein